MGDMDEAIFDRLVAELRRFPHLESVMFGGFGEPTAHPDILAHDPGRQGASASGPR